MTSAEVIPAVVLKRKAVVYVRQSTQSQVMTNLESKRRQYDLVDVARQRGFVDVEIIDDDLGRSASGTVARPGFDRLVAWLCAGKVGAVLCFDASRLARNGRDWHHLLELCGLVEARVIDLDGVYNPCRPNDRLLLGMKGSISEFELGVLRARMLDAARSKAAGANCAYRFRSAISGTVKRGLVLILIYDSRRSFASSSSASANSAARARFCSRCEPIRSTSHVPPMRAA
jgi:DNA invertase Pin-like site-specific DNA recombinase